MASKSTDEYNLAWLSGCVEEWLLKSGESNGFSLKKKGEDRVYINCPKAAGEVYIELGEQELSLWTEQASLQTLIQNSGVLDLLEGSDSQIQDPVPALEALAHCLVEEPKSEQSTDMDELSDDNNQPGENICYNYDSFSWLD